MGTLVKQAGWAALALIGAFALGTVALSRGESINALWIVVAAIALAVVAFFSFRKRRIRMLDQDPEALFEKREILLGPAADRIAEAIELFEREGADTVTGVRACSAVWSSSLSGAGSMSIAAPGSWRRALRKWLAACSEEVGRLTSRRMS